MIVAVMAICARKPDARATAATVARLVAERRGEALYDLGLRQERQAKAYDRSQYAKAIAEITKDLPWDWGRLELEQSSFSVAGTSAMYQAKFDRMGDVWSNGFAVHVVQEQGTFRPLLGPLLLSLSRRAGESPQARFARLLEAMEVAGIRSIEDPSSFWIIRIDRLRDFVEGRIAESALREARN